MLWYAIIIQVVLEPPLDADPRRMVTAFADSASVTRAECEARGRDTAAVLQGWSADDPVGMLVFHRCVRLPDTVPVIWSRLPRG